MGKKRLQIIPVAMLTYKRPDLLRQTLESFIVHNRSQLDRFRFFIFVQNWPDPETMTVINFFSNLFDEIILSRANTGSTQGMLNSLNRAALKYPDSKYLMMLEDDWESRDSLSLCLDEVLSFLDSDPLVGYIRLRAVHQRVFNKNPMTREEIKYIPVSDLIYRGNMHFTMNPLIFRREILDRFNIVENMTKESHMIQACHGLFQTGAQLRKDCFWHIGLTKRTRPWRP